MEGVGDSDAGAAGVPGGLLSQLSPGEPLTAAELVEQIGLWKREPAGATAAAAGRPRVLLNMVSSADGSATLAGRSGDLSSAADRELFHALRLASDAVLVGAGTVRAERYGRIVRDPAARRLRVERGLAPEPLACVVSGSMSLDPSIPLLADPQARVAILTRSDGELAGAAAEVSYVCLGTGAVNGLDAALRELRARFGVQLLLCEGGPHLGAELLAGGLLDELYLSLSPTLVGGDEPATENPLRILSGAPLHPPVKLELLGAARGGSHLFLRYAVLAPERVSRETTSSSSPAR